MSFVTFMFFILLGYKLQKFKKKKKANFSIFCTRFFVQFISELKTVCPEEMLGYFLKTERRIL